MKKIRSQIAPPVACRPEAFEYVRQQLSALDSTEGLMRCVVGVALHALDDVRPQEVDEEIERLAALVRTQCPSANLPGANRTAVLTHLHEVFFDREGFCGSPPECYYNPLNSYLPAVLKLKHGLPITLGLVYKAVAEKVGLAVEGIYSRGHFLLRVQDEQGWLIVDPYHRGRILTVAEACQLISSIVDEPLDPSERYLPAATNQQWLRRVIVNLVQVFQAMQLKNDLRAMHELLVLVDGHV